MIKKIYAPQVDRFVDWLGYVNRGGFNDNCTFTKTSYELIDKFFELLKKISPISENGCRELWFCIDRGSIEDFGDYEEMYELGEVENYEEFEQQWKDYYPDEKRWYYIEAVCDEEVGYKAVTVNHKFVIVINPRAEKDASTILTVLQIGFMKKPKSAFNRWKTEPIWILCVQIFRLYIKLGL